MDLEIYIFDIDVMAAVRWLEEKVGGLSTTEVSDDIHYLRTDHPDIRVVVTPSIEEGPFLSMYLKGDWLPWERSEQFALRCAEELGKTVRWCDAATNAWFEKTGSADPVHVELDAET